MPTKTDVQVQLGRRLFEFSTFEDWVNNAGRRYRLNEATSRTTIAIDGRGRLCTCGADMQAARDDDEFPVVIYEMRPPQNGSENPTGE